MYLSNVYAHIKFTLHKIYGCHTLLPFVLVYPLCLVQSVIFHLGTVYL